MHGEPCNPRVCRPSLAVVRWPATWDARACAGVDPTRGPLPAGNPRRSTDQYCHDRSVGVVALSLGINVLIVLPRMIDLHSAAASGVGVLAVALWFWFGAEGLALDAQPTTGSFTLVKQHRSCIALGANSSWRQPSLWHLVSPPMSMP
jgi:hypothetical protein